MTIRHRCFNCWDLLTMKTIPRSSERMPRSSQEIIRRLLLATVGVACARSTLGAMLCYGLGVEQDVGQGGTNGPHSQSSPRRPRRIRTSGQCDMAGRSCLTGSSRSFKLSSTKGCRRSSAQWHTRRWVLAAFLCQQHNRAVDPAGTDVPGEKDIWATEYSGLSTAGRPRGPRQESRLFGWRCDRSEGSAS
jgi:hypothetical protein